MGVTDRPLFRTDLVSRPIEDAGHRFIEVTDPDSGNSFRFYEIEYAIACAMDGERDVDELVDWARIELGLEPSSDELQTVISTLGELGYLGTGFPGEAQAAWVEPGRAEPPRVDSSRAEPPGPEPPPLDRPPPAGRAVSQPAPSFGPSPFDFGFDAPIATPLPGRGPGERPLDLASELSPDLSTDLSEHLPVRAADVQEALRQSRSMRAARPSPPPEDEDFDDQKTPVPMGNARAPAAAAAGVDPFAAASRTPPPAAQAPGQPGAANMKHTLLGTGAPPGGFGQRTPTPRPVGPPEQSVAKPEAAAAGPARPTVAARPAAMVQEARGGGTSATEPPIVRAPRSAGFLPYLIVLLLLSAAGAAAYWYFFVYQDSGSAEGSVTMEESPPKAGSVVEQGPGAGPATPPSAPTPTTPRLTATLEAGPTAETEVRSPRAGRVTWVAPSGGEVSEGDPVAKFEGYRSPEYQVKLATESQSRYRQELEEATAADNKQAINDAESNVRRKQRDIDRHNAELEKFMVKAPQAGVVEPALKEPANVTEDQPVVKILGQSAPRASFNLPPGTTHNGTAVRVVSTSDPSLSADCKVDSAQPGQLVVSCPTDSGLASGTQVELRP